MNKIDRKMDRNILDYYLLKALRNLRDSNNMNKGVVTACLYSNDSKLSYATSEKLNEGQWIHAERNALTKYLSSYESPDKDSVMIVSLSPCYHDKNTIRKGHSCIDLLLGKDAKFKDVKISNVHVGLIDPTQLTFMEYLSKGLNVTVSNNPLAIKSCNNLFKYFSPEIYGKVNIHEFLQEALKEV